MLRLVVAMLVIFLSGAYLVAIESAPQAISAASVVYVVALAGAWVAARSTIGTRGSR